MAFFGKVVFAETAGDRSGNVSGRTTISRRNNILIHYDNIIQSLNKGQLHTGY